MPGDQPEETSSLSAKRPESSTSPEDEPDNSTSSNSKRRRVTEIDGGAAGGGGGRAGGRGCGGRGGGRGGGARGGGGNAKLVKILCEKEIEEIVKTAHKEVLSSEEMGSQTVESQHATIMYDHLKKGIPAGLPRAHAPIGAWMANLVFKKFRYINDMTVLKNPHVLLQFDGVLYKREADRNNVEREARIAAQKVAAVVVAKLRTRVEETNEEIKQLPDEENQAQKKELENKVKDAKALSFAFENMNRALDGSAFNTAVCKFMHQELSAEGFYLSLGLPTPTELYNLMDENAELVAFTNGIFHMRAKVKLADGSEVERPKFYRKGAIHPTWAVSISTGHKWIGNDDGKPANDDQKARMEKLENNTIKKYFFKKEMYDAAIMLIGCLYYGQIVKKMFLLLGSAGNNGKSQLVRMIKRALGAYVGTIPKAMLVKRKNKDEDPNKPNPLLCAIRNLRAVFVTETDINDELDPKPVKEFTGGDEQAMRGLFGRVIEAVLQPIIVWVSNFAPKYPGTDTPLAKRLDFAVECSAHFGDDVTEDDSANGRFKCTDSGSFANQLKADTTIISLLFMSYAIKFAEAGLKMPRAPPSEATRAVQNGASGSKFYSWFSENYISTAEAKNTDRIEWDKHNANGATSLSAIIDSFNEENCDGLTKKEAKTILESKGVFVGKIVFPERVRKGCNSPKSIADGLRFKRKPETTE